MSRQDRCFLVEGYLDVISMHQLGITNVVASSGTSLTTDQVRLIKRFTENVTIIYDGDSAGIHAALRGIGLVLKEGMNVKVVLLPDGDDPDSYSRKHTLAEVQDFIASHEQDFIGFKSDILLGEAGDDPLKRANLINDVADTIALIPDAVKRSVYVDTCSAKFNIEPQLLFDRIGHTRGEMLSEEKRQMEYRKRREESSAADAGEAARLPDNAGQIPVLPVQAPEGLALEDRYLAPCERELLEFIVVSGDETLNFDRDSEFYSETEPPVPVAEFIDAALADDDVAFSNTIYRKTYDEYFSLYDKGLAQGQIRKRLLDNEDRDVAAVAKDILVDKYILTVENYRQSLTSESTRLVMNVPKSLLVYQLRRLDKMQKELEARLVDAGESPEEQMDIIRKMDGINKARTIINKKIGRV